MLNPENPIVKIPLTIAAMICVAPIFIIAKGSSWIKKHIKKH